MVGRLVEDKQVDWFEQELDHRQPGTLASGKDLYLLGRILASEHECAKQILDLVADVALGHVIDCLEYGQVLVE